MKKFFIGAVVIVAIGVIFSVVTDRIAKDRIQKRVAYWQSVIDAELPLGVTKERVGQWINKRHLSMGWNNISFWGDVEEVHYIGNPIPCGNAQSIRVELEVNEIITKDQVDAVGLNWDGISEKLIKNGWVDKISPSEVGLSANLDGTVLKLNFSWAPNGIAILNELINKGVLTEDSSGKVYLIRKEGQPISRPTELSGIHFNEIWGIWEHSLEGQKDRMSEIFGSDFSKIYPILRDSLDGDGRYTGGKVYPIARCM